MAVQITRRQIYWLCQFYGWGLYTVLLYVVNLLRQPELHAQSAEKYIPFAGVIVFGILLTHGFRKLAIRQGWVSRPLTQQLIIIPLGALALGLLHNALLVLLAFLSQGVEVPGPLDLVVNLVNLTALYLLWMLIYFAIKYFTNYKKEEIAKLRQEAMVHQMELHTLRSQINPHFIFNALNGIRGLVLEDPRRAQEAVTQLARLLRNVLRTEHYDLIPLEQELALVQDYLALEQVRYEERLLVELHSTPEALAAPVPALSVLTLVENAIKHGISQQLGGGTLHLQARITSDQLVITVTNPGQLTGSPQAESSGYGLRNIQERLVLLYKAGASLNVSQVNEQQVTATLYLPLHPAHTLNPNIRTL
ncbi:MAG: histidine kinase [Bacteroidetes bacterium]|nr:histidine kinase [Bacteroidota bacterium]